MKKITIILLSFMVFSICPAQKKIIYQSGTGVAENLRAVVKKAPYSSGFLEFDNRYEGVKGTARLFDTLFNSSLLLKGQTGYIRIDSDIDIVNNSLVIKESGAKELKEIPSGAVTELLVHKKDTTLIFRPVRELSFEDKVPFDRFCLVLKESPNGFIRVPEKIFIKADYTSPYNTDRRYDELELINKYYIEDSANIYRRVQMNEKSLIKLYPGKKELIKNIFADHPDADVEEKIIFVLNKF